MHKPRRPHRFFHVLTVCENQVTEQSSWIRGKQELANLVTLYIYSLCRCVVINTGTTLVRAYWKTSGKKYLCFIFFTYCNGHTIIKLINPKSNPLIFHCYLIYSNISFQLWSFLLKGQCPENAWHGFFICFRPKQWSANQFYVFVILYHRIINFPSSVLNIQIDC